MSKTEPILSVIVRRYKADKSQQMDRLLTEIEAAMQGLEGFHGLQRSTAERRGGMEELTTVFSFDTVAHLKAWERSPDRQRIAAQLDELSDDTSYTRFSDLRILNHPSATLTKAQTVMVLIFWIVLWAEVLNWAAAAALPASWPVFLVSVLKIAVSVVLISYIFLPWSSRVLSQLKTRRR